MKAFAINTILILVLLAMHSSVCPAQNPPPPPKPIAKATPVDRAEFSEAELEAKILKTLGKPQAWKQYEFPGFDLKVDLPREPVRQTETFYDEALGNSKMELQVAVGDDATYVVGHILLPYAITEEKLLRETYQEAIKEFAADPDLKFESPKDYYFNGKLGIEMTSVVSDPRFLPTRMRVFILGRSIYLMMSVPMITVGNAPPAKGERDRVSAEFDRFFASAKPKVEIAQPTTPVVEPPIFRGTFANRVYRSEYFGFSITMPESWLQVSAEDVEGVRKWGRDYLAANSAQPLPNLKSRQTLASFVSKPLGSERVAMLAINLGLASDQPDAAMRMAQLAEGLLSKVQTYKLVTGATPAKLGSMPAVKLVGKFTVDGEVQNQIIYLVHRRGYVLAFTLTYYDELDRETLEKAFETLKFGES